MMLRLNRCWSRARSGDDSGMALLSVLAVLFLLTGFLMVTLAFAVGNLRPAKADQNAKAAQAAAQAGIDDFVARLTSSPNYWQRAQPGQLDTSNPALSTGARVGGTNATYTYSLVQAPGSASSGLVLRATGSVGGVTRSLTASMDPQSFLQYLYFTDKEDQSPRYNGITDTWCTKRWWEGRQAAASGICQEIAFANGDTLDGDVHTNDTPLLSGLVTFKKAFETSTMTGAQLGTQCSGATCYRIGAASPSFGGSAPEYAPVAQIPASNTELLNNATKYGCVYIGATQIEFVGTSMKVYSPDTTSINDPSCFNVANRSSTQTVPVRKAIYVKDCASSCTSSANFPALSGEYGVNTGDLHHPDYAGSLGTAYIKGTVAGDVTLGSAQDIVVTGNLVYATDPTTNARSTDILGLIPTHTVWVYHPVTATSYGYANLLSSSAAVTKIQAAILTVQDSFMVQDYDKGPQVTGPDGSPKLTVYGSLAQNYRGTVAFNEMYGQQHGYVKNYVYDSRFSSGYLAPTYFLKPTSARWVVNKVTDG